MTYEWIILIAALFMFACFVGNVIIYFKSYDMFWAFQQLLAENKRLRRRKKKEK